ncbi:MAG: MerR family transcriptional regulator [Alphaproteobacteria bacterium]|nr:MerR family transcriptional regulator [Alphaproteobacteria bacterium]
MMKEYEVVAVIDGLTVRRLRTWVRQGWVRPAQRDGDVVFSDVDAARLRLICQLRHEMNVGAEAMPIILSLIDQLYGVRHEFKCVMEALESQSSAVREEIIRHARRTREPSD